MLLEANECSGAELKEKMEEFHRVQSTELDVEDEVRPFQFY